MRKYGLVAAAAGLALSGSLAKADFVISSNRVNNGATDTVTFSVVNTNTGSTAGLPNMLTSNVLVYAPTSYNGQTFANNGLIVQTDDSATASSGFINYTGPSANAGSYLPAPYANVNTLLQAQSLGLNKSSVDDFLSPSVFADGSKVAAMGAQYAQPTIKPFGSVATSPGVIAVAVVPAGDPVLIMQESPTGSDIAGNRNDITQFFPSATEFTADVSSGTHNKTLLQPSNASTSVFADPGSAVPEPASLGLIGIGLAGLVARRRRV